jgi:hypothetical protein
LFGDVLSCAGSRKEPAGLVVHGAVVSALGEVLMDQGEQSFGYGCGRVSDPDGGSCRCGVDVVECEFADFADGGAVEQQDQCGDSGR